MPRPRRRTDAASSRVRRSDRHGHGRSPRSSAAGPHLPPLRNRIEQFDMTVASTAQYLRGLYPEQLADVTFVIATTPKDPPREGASVDRWRVSGRRITLYRLPIQRLSHLHRDDDLHRRLVIESCVFRAVAELLGKDPWDLAPDRYRHF